MERVRFDPAESSPNNSCPPDSQSGACEIVEVPYREDGFGTRTGPQIHAMGTVRELDPAPCPPTMGYGAFFRAAMMSARSLASEMPMRVFAVPGRNLLGEVRNLSRSASVQLPPAFRSAGE